jgi:hypothetical protein
MSAGTLTRRLRRGALLGALLAVAAAAAAQPAGATTTEVVKWPWGLTRIIRAPSDTPFAGVGGLAVSPQGEHLFVGSAGVVDEYSSTGAWEQTWSAHFKHIVGLASDQLGDIYVADSGAGQVQKFDESGKPLATWSIPGVQGIAADAHGRVYLLVSIVLGQIVDVRSFSGADLGSWSAVLPGNWFPPSPSSYSTASTAGITAVTADAAGNVYLTGRSRQHLEGKGPDCHSVFDVSKYYEFAYADPLETNEIAEYNAAGQVLNYEFTGSGAAACYPGWRSANRLTDMLAVSPVGTGVWISEEYGAFAENFILGTLQPVRENLYSNCVSCEGVYEEPGLFEGPALFDCHNNLFFGAGARVFEFVTTAPTVCPKPPSRFGKVTFGATLKITLPKPKLKEKGYKALDFEVGCTSGGCPIRITAALRLPHCHRGSCVHVLASHSFDLAGGKLADLSLPLGRAGAALGARPQILLSARLLRQGHPYGHTFWAGGGRPLLALAAVPLTLSCPSSVALGGQIQLSGTLGLHGPHPLSLVIVGRGPVSIQSLTTSAAGTFALTVPAAPAGKVGFAVSFAGDRTHGPAGAECGTQVPGPPPPVLLPPPILKEEPPKEPPPPPPIETKLTLTCRPPSGGEFKGTLTPALGGQTITIAYHYKEVGSVKEEVLEDTATTTAEGKYKDKGPPGGATGTAKASWPGTSGYAGSSSETCEFP